MKLSKLALLPMLCCTALPVAAQSESSYYNQQASTSMQNLVLYFQNFGGYLGYDVTQNPDKNDQTKSRQSLINMTAAQVAQVALFNTFLGAIPVNAFSSALSLFIPTGTPIASTINSFANTTFSSYNTPTQGGGSGNIGVSNLIDQQTYQNDPVSQAVLNILGTPNYTYCYIGTDSTNWNKDCPYTLFDTNVPAKVIGDLPDAKKFFSFNYIQAFLSQLNSNALTAPLLYSTEQQQSAQQPGGGNQKSNQGLTAQSQAQQAANFIRYVSGSVTPISLPAWDDYQRLFDTATANMTGNSTVTLTQKNNAQAILSTYLANLRTYAAQSSVGLSNLYFIMSKRLPQNAGGQGTTGAGAGTTTGTGQPPMSQSLGEFNMATWRIYNPASQSNTGAGNTQWMNEINNASSATVQKEIAILLAEINYQMYLDRQLQERILLTNSIMLLQNTKAAQPNNFSTATK